MQTSSKQRKHIVHIIPGLPYGGAERFLVDMSNMMVQQYPIDITIIVFRDNIPMGAELDPRITVIQMHKKKVDISFVRRLKRELQSLSPDIVHTHLWGADVYGGRAAQTVGLPWVSTEHNVNVNESWLHHKIKRMAIKSAKEVMITSEDERTFCHDVYHIPDNKLLLLPYYINLDALLKNSILPLSEPVRFLIVGRLVQQKGIEMALRALGTLGIDNWHCTIVGIGEEEESLHAIAKQYNINEKISWNKPNSDIASVYAAHHVLLMPSLWEGFGIVGLEAQASGLPVIGNMVGGLPEYIKHDVTGYLVPEHTLTAWKEAISQYLKDPNRITRQAEAAKQSVRSSYDASYIAAQYYDWYTKHMKLTA